MKKAKIIKLTALATVFFIAFSALIIKFGSFNKAKAIVVDVDIEDEYCVGYELTIPSARISYNGTYYDSAEAYLVYPNGDAYSKNVYNLSVEGKYTINYIIKVNDKKIIATKDFSVCDPFYDFKSSAGDGLAVKNAALSYERQLKTVINPDGSENIGGLNVSLPKDVVLQYNTPLDLNELQDNPVITVYPYNLTYLFGRDGSTIEAYNIVVRLTDCNDENNYIEMDYNWAIRQYSVYPFLYYRAGANGSERTSFSACDHTDNGAFLYNGAYYKRRQAGLGVYSLYSRSDAYDVINDKGQHIQPATNPNYFYVHDTYLKSCGFNFYFDKSSNEVYCGEVLGVSNPVKKRFVANVASTEIYGKQAFKGFTSDKVYLSVYAENYNTSNKYNTSSLPVVNLEIGNIFGQMNDELDKLSLFSSDDIPPYITVEGMDGKELLAVAKVGSEIIIPKAEAVDKNLKSFNKYVYYDCGDGVQSLVCAGDDFVVNKVGLYTVKYVAEDYNKNISEKTIIIHVRQDAAADSLRLIDNLPAKNIYSGEWFKPKYSVVGDNVYKNSKIYYSYNGGDYIIAEDGQFFVEHCGKYSVKYVYSDIIMQKETVVEYTAVDNGNVIFNPPVLPYAFIKEATYTLDKAYAYTYENENPLLQICDVYVSADDGEFTLIADTDEFKVSANDNVKFKYVCKEKEFTTEKVAVINVGYNGVLQKEKYFRTNNIDSVKSTEKYIEFSGTGNREKTITFINKLSLTNFKLDYVIPQELSDLEFIELTFIDYYNRDNKVLLQGKRNSTMNNALAFWIGDSRMYPQINFVDSPITLEYKAGGIWWSGNHANFGTKFTTDAFLLEIKLKGSYNDGATKSGIRIYSLNGTLMDNGTEDITAAQIVTNGTYSKKEFLNKTVFTGRVEIFDVFTPFCKKNLQIRVYKDSRDNVLRDVNGVKLSSDCDPTENYAFTVSEAGRYFIQYIYTDEHNVRTGIIKSFDTIEERKPQIIIEDGVESGSRYTASYNSTHKIKTYEYNDNDDAANLMFSVLILKPNTELAVASGDEVVLNQKGEWRIIYRCVDSDGNQTTAYYILNVK